MKVELISRCDGGAATLVLLFAGWSCEAQQFAALRLKGCDVAVVYDYRSLEFEQEYSSSYDRVVVVAWSFGVWAASHLMSRELLDFSALNIAINGTPVAVDDSYGIPSRAFALTVRSIAAGGIDKFNQRVYGSCYDSETLSARAFEEQVEELKKLSDYFVSYGGYDAECWDVAMAGAADLIFPVDNMVNFWNKNSIFTLILENTPHYPFTEEGILELNRVIERGER